jgi:predicted nucleic acid-binding protein
MIGAVLDTNVMVSALMREGSPPSMVLNAALKKSFRCFVSNEVFAEYEAIYARYHLKLPSRDVVFTLKEFRKIATWVTPRKAVHAAFDQDDKHVSRMRAGGARGLRRHRKPPPLPSTIPGHTNYWSKGIYNDAFVGVVGQIATA